MMRQPPREILALQPLHGEEGLSLVGDAVGHVGDDAGVVHLEEQPGLAREALGRIGVTRRMDQLERHGLTVRRVQGPVDGAHAAAARQVLKEEAAREEGTEGRKIGRRRSVGH
jgi:hypothetical protein